MILRGGLGYVLVACGGLVVSVVPASSAMARLPLVGELRETMPGRMFGLAVVVAGLGLAASAWLQLVRHVQRAHRPEKDRMVLVRRATVWWCVPLLLAPAMFSRDGWSYAAQGEMTRQGISPYVWTPSVLTGPIVEAVDPRWMDSLTPYGPVPLIWGALAAHGTSDPWLLVVAYRGLSLVGLALLAYAVPRLASWAWRDPALASALVLPSPLMLAHGVAGVHNDVVMAGLVAVTLVVAIERSWVLGAVLGGVAAAVKLPAGLVCIGVALVSLSATATRPQRVGRLGAVGALSVGSLVLIGAMAGVGVGWIHALGVPGEVRTPFSVTTQLGRLLSFVLACLDIGTAGIDPVAVLRLLGSAAVMWIAARVALRAPTGVPAAGARAVALVLASALALSPVVHPWYLLWCLPILVTCHLTDRGSTSLLHLSWLVGLVAPLDSSLEGAGGAIIGAVVLIGGIAGVQLATHRSVTSRHRTRGGAGEQPDSRAHDLAEDQAECSVMSDGA